LTFHLYSEKIPYMMTLTEFAAILAKRAKRKKPFSKSYMFWLINAGRIKPVPEKIGKGKGVYILEDDADIVK